ncbi:MAG: hypothetical protein P8I99_03945 [Acidimicrobiales bacterium]|nr:hypothetical protein [Acidimicrobiales bacterium]MDG1876553.1 hypothetical protein [Acidimicrobiales bacterium]
MTTTLLFLALLAAANPIRVHAVRPGVVTPQVLAFASATVLALGAAFALLSGPMLGLVDVSVSSARIAAGVALIVVSVRDAIGPVPQPKPSLVGHRTGIVPVAFPAALTPPTALLMIAAGADRGVGLAVAVLAGVLVVVLAALCSPRLRGLRPLLAATGAGGVAVGVLVAMDGVLAI